MESQYYQYQLKGQEKGTSKVLNFSFTVNQDQATANNCEQFFIGLSTGSAGNFGRLLKNDNFSIPYNAYTTKNLDLIVKDVGQAAQEQELISGRINGRKKRGRFSIVLHVPPFDVFQTKAGVHEDTLIMSLYSGSFSNPQLVQQRPWKLITNIPLKVDLSIVGRGGNYKQGDRRETLRFGKLVQGEKRFADVIVKSNTGHRLSISSENNGKMKHRRKNYTVDYTFHWNGVPINLTGSKTNPILLHTSPNPTRSDGLPFHVEVVVGSTRNALEGRYKDHLLLTVSSI